LLWTQELKLLTVPMVTEIGITLTHQLKDPLHKELPELRTAVYWVIASSSLVEVY
jgi:hypothetical protein